MKISKVDGGVWVNVGDYTQKPEPNTNYLIKFDDGEIAHIEDELPFSIITHWLKPIEQVFILTQEELTRLIAKYDMELTQTQWKHGASMTNAEQFIKLITQ